MQLFSSDVGMTINLSKSARLVVSRGKIIETTGVNIEALVLVSDVDVSKGYKYLGVLQDLLISHQTVKDNLIREYCSRLRSVLSSYLNGHNKIIAINSYAIPVLRYSAGIISWTQSDLDEIDRKTRKLMTIYKGLHPKSDVHRLYLPRKSGGRGLLNIKHVVNTECQALSNNVLLHSDHPLLRAVQYTVVYFSSLNVPYLTSNQNGCKIICSSGRVNRQFPSQVEALTTVDCAYKWLRVSGLKIETEA